MPLLWPVLAAILSMSGARRWSNNRDCISSDCYRLIILRYYRLRVTRLLLGATLSRATGLLGCINSLPMQVLEVANLGADLGIS